MSSDDENNFNLFKSTSFKSFDEYGNGNDFQNNNISSPLNLNEYENVITKYERKICHRFSTFNGNQKFHFDFSGSLNISPNKKNISDKKRKCTIDINKISTFKRIIESNALYVGFENKYGENCCYINVILHFLYFFPCINEYLIKIYKTKKDSLIYNGNNIADNDLLDFFVLLGKTLFEYQKVLSNLNNKGIMILNTTELRQSLDKISNNLYKFNKVADPVELLIFLLNIINKDNKNEVHNDFFINLIEELQCNGSCQKNIVKNYDEDNFIFHIYINEILNYINQNNILFNDYNHNLFKISKNISLNYFKNCDKCGNKIRKLLKFKEENYPTFLLINCIWSDPRQALEDVIKFFYILPLEDCLDNLFINMHNNNNKIYNLLGMILYSPALSHYINVIFNIQKNIFVLYNDDKIKELNSIHEVYKEITLEQIKRNDTNIFYYPVLLIYYKEIIYDDLQTIKKNIYSFDEYNFLIEECSKLKEKEKQNLLTDEQKKQNYIELVQAQMKYEKNHKKDKYSKNNHGSSFLQKVKEDNEDDKESSLSLKMDIEEDEEDKNKNINKNNIINDLKMNNQNYYSYYNNGVVKETHELNGNINNNNKIINNGINDIFNNNITINNKHGNNNLQIFNYRPKKDFFSNIL